MADVGSLSPVGDDAKEPLKAQTPPMDLGVATPPSSGSSAVQSPELKPIRSNGSVTNRDLPSGTATPVTTVTGTGTPISTTTSKKPGTFRSLSRMFSHRKEEPATKEAPPKQVFSDISESKFIDYVGTLPTSKPVDGITAATAALSRQSTAAPPLQRTETGKEQPKTRFELFDDGTHEHHLKSAKRQEKLRTMLKDLLGGRKKDESAVQAVLPVDGQLSLMSNWVDQLKLEKEKSTADRKGSVASTATMVEKYGKCQEVIGRGAFGVVRISHKQDPNGGKSEQLYAVKEFRRRPHETAKKYQKRLMSEFCISSTLRHPNIIHTLDLMENADGEFCEIMEFCAGGDLYTLVLAAGKLKTPEADCFFKQLMRGVEYIHEMGVAHRDLKPENLLLTPHGSLKITDFGNGECFRSAWETEAHMTVGMCGSAPYIAPEEYTDKEFDPRAVDVWACGVIYMAMRTGRHLWRVAEKERDEFYERYLEGRRDEAGYQPIEQLHRAKCRNVVYSILDPNPARRITASQVLKSEWVKDVVVCKAGQEGY